MRSRSQERYLCVKGEDSKVIFPSNWQDCYHFNPRMDYGVLLVKAGVFKSVNDAWELGYQGQVPFGWNNFSINDNSVYIYNPVPDQQEQDELPWYGDSFEFKKEN